MNAMLRDGDEFAPSDYLNDEQRVDLLASPDTWLSGAKDGDKFVLVGGAGDDKMSVAIGETVVFSVYRHYPSVTVKAGKDGDFEFISGFVEPEANLFYADDEEGAMDTLSEFIAHEIEDGNVQPGEEFDVEVRAWLEFDFKLVEGPKFELVGKTFVPPPDAVPVSDDNEPFVVVDQPALLEALNLANLVVERRSTIPILAHVLLDTDDDLLTLTVGNLDQEVKVCIKAVTHGRIRLAVPLGELASFVATDPSPGLMLELCAEGISVRGQHRCGGGRELTLPCLPASDWPNPVKHAEKLRTSLCTADLLAAIDRVRPAISTEETRYYLNGICFHTHAESADMVSLRLVATDGHRLAMDSLPWNGDSVVERTILPRKAVKMLAEALSGTKDIFIVTEFGEMSMRLSWVTDALAVCFTSKCIDGTFPTYEKVFPDASDIAFTASAAELKRALDGAAFMDKSGNGPGIVALSFEKGGSFISAAGIDPRMTYDDGLVGDFNGPEQMKVGLRRSYLAQLVGGFGASAVKMTLIDPSSPIHLTVDGLPRVHFLLMPVRL